jgi:hypothetical protein
MVDQSHPRTSEGFVMSEPHDAGYESPRLEVLGTVEALTALTDKKFGATDGYTFMGIAIANASP